jgi:ribose 5-phosphate isomerase B
MRIAMASDHAGRALKEEIKALLTAGGHEVLDFGTETGDPADLPDYVLPATLAVARREVDRGIFVDGVGYGSAMIANKVGGVFAAVCQDPFCAELARSHSDTNVQCMAARSSARRSRLRSCGCGWPRTGSEQPRPARSLPAGSRRLRTSTPGTGYRWTERTPRAAALPSVGVRPALRCSRFSRGAHRR